MKHQLLFICAVGTYFQSLAQPTLNSTDVSVPFGTVVNAVSLPYTDPGSPGSNATWDFSGLSGGEPFSNEMLSPGNSPFQNLFPTATNAGNSWPDIGRYIYWTENAQGFYNNGFADSPTSNCIYSDTEQFWAFPLSMGSSWSDPWGGTCMGNGSSSTRSGTTTGTVTGWGTVILPFGSFDDVLRVELDQVYTDIFPLLGIDINYEVHIVSYVKAGADIALFSSGIILLDLGLGLDTASTYSIMAAPTSVGVEDLSANHGNVLLYPNPAQGVLNLKLEGIEPSSKEVTIRVVDAVGAEVRMLYNGAISSNELKVL